MNEPSQPDTKRIRELNDAFRTTFAGGRVLMTSGVSELPLADQMMIQLMVRTFSDFTEGNDSYGEHDFGAFDHAGVQYFWKIDYYDQECRYGSEEPADPAVTTRVLTILRGDEY